ncbi:hypothetical protein [Persicitalea sp.]|uniref:hypothetical protein n=1 Tax=Persicitalea sp. TaxID=3100273 RepID=UPI0035944C0B
MTQPTPRPNGSSGFLKDDGNSSESGGKVIGWEEMLDRVLPRIPARALNYFSDSTESRKREKKIQLPSVKIQSTSISNFSAEIGCINHYLGSS